MKSSEIERAIRHLKLREPFSAKTVQRALPNLDATEIADHLRKNAVKFNRAHKPTYIRVMRGWYRLNER
ncbi:hypothetical protein Brsp06_02106 [Brucella sp. NBRC 13694]